MLRKILDRISDSISLTLKLILALTLGAIGVALIASAGMELMGISLSPKQYQSMKDLPSLELEDSSTNSKAKKDGMIGLFKKERDGKIQFHCTAFVVSDKLAITAGHCIIDSEGFLTKDEIIVKDSLFQDTGVIAHGAAVNLRADMGVIAGDFSKFNKMKMNLNPGGFFGTHGPYLTCGFPWGDNPGLCTQFVLKGNYYFQEQGFGHLYPGMSGGPVIDMPSGQVVAINTMAEDGTVVVAPLVGIVGALELQVK